jgi:hypothetical protein
MKPFLIYLIIGAIVAIITALNQSNIHSKDDKDFDDPLSFHIIAYFLIAIAWPVSVIVSVYSIVTSLMYDSYR